MFAVLRVLVLTSLFAVTPVVQAEDAAPVAAALSGSALAHEVSVQIDVLRVNVNMMIYDDTITTYNDAARDGMAALAPLMADCQRDVAARDATAGQTLASNWQVVQDALLGGGEFSEGILTLGYDAAQQSYFIDSVQQIALQLAGLYPANDAPIAQQAYVLMARAVSNYILAAASPFGAYTSSFNAGDADDPAVMVARIDGMLAALHAQYRGDAAKEAKVAHIRVKWRFIRGAMTIANQKSMPTIVYRHGIDIIRELNALQASAT